MERSKRVPVSMFMKIDGVPGARTRDISTTGAFIETQTPLEVGSKHELSLLWDDTTCRCLARVARHESGGVGVEFEANTGRFQATIKEVLGELDPKPSVRKVGG